ncbi:MAG: FAD-dependent oxidoreductase [Clostridium sp.]|nr:FAD-dependent oxidoreductase [Clostridium sp.]
MLDTIIIGSGPAGLSASIYIKRANLNVLVIEKDYEGTGQIAESGKVDNYLGIPGISGYELGEKFREHALKAGVNFLEANVINIKNQKDNIIRVELENGEYVEAKTIIYAAGATHRRLNVLGEEKYLGRGVSYCAICDGAFYKNKVVAVIGGGDVALDDAVYLSEIAKKVYLIHRRKEFRGAESTLNLLKEKENVEILIDSEVDSILGDDKVTGILLKNKREIILDGIFSAIGMIPKTEILKELIDLDEYGYVKADETGETNLKGFFVAGDVRQKELRQIVTAVSDGANAATSAINYIRDNI